MTWTWWMTLLVIFAVLVLIGCIPVGVDARYSEAGVFLAAKIGPFRLQLLPAKPKKPQKPKKPKQTKAENPSEKAAAPQTAASHAPADKKSSPLPGGLNGILRLAQLAASTLGDLRRKLRVDELTLHLIFGSDDPADAALRYGQAWAAIGALTPTIERLFVIKKRDIHPVLDYNRDKLSVDAHLILTITIGRALSLGLRAGVGFLKIYLSGKQESKKGGANK